MTWARDLVNEPAEAKSPEAVAAQTKRLAAANGLKVQVLSGAQLEKARLGGVIGVGKGSERPPRFLKLSYEPAGAKATLAFVGKGVVFDSGGLSIKTAAGMETMKTDMSGAAAVIAAMSTLRDLDVKTRARLRAARREHAERLGDAARRRARMRNGKTVEVLNTDAEGRLILADALSLAAEDKPDAVIDLATLTGACVVALGEGVAGIMGTDEAWIAGARRRRPRRRVGVAAAAPRAVPQDARLRGRRHEEHLARRLRRRAHGRAVPQGVRRRTPWAHLDINRSGPCGERRRLPRARHRLCAALEPTAPVQALSNSHDPGSLLVDLYDLLAYRSPSGRIRSGSARIRAWSRRRSSASQQ